MSNELGWWLKVTHPLHLYEGVNKLGISVLLGTSTQLVLCFVLLGICASDHLCPNVAFLTKSGKSSRGVIASILLAWCNSSPDLFSNLISWLNSESPASLSIGEVLGSCGIIICIIQGLLLYCMRESLDLSVVQRNSLVIDLLFALLALSCVLCIVITNSVAWYVSAFMILVYVSYVMSKMKLNSNIQDVEDPQNNIGVKINDPHHTETGFPMDGSIRPSLLETMDLNIFIQMLENANNAETITMNNMHTTSSMLSSKTVDLKSFKHSSVRPASEPSQKANSISTFGNADSMDTFTDRANISTAPTPSTFSPFVDDVTEEGEARESDPAITTETFVEPPLQYKDTLASSTQRIMNSIFYLLFPNFKNWNLKTLQSKALSIILSPMVFLLRLCVPQYSEDAKLNFPIIISQAIMAPVMGMLVIESLLDTKISAWFWFIPASLSLTFLTGVLFLRYKRRTLFHLSLYAYSDDTANINDLVIKISNSIGIINSILCISLLANILIEIIELYQKLTGISKSLLGMTLFAWGNSISDLMSNLAMSQLYQKLPTPESQKSAIATRFLSISLSACIGGVLLNTTIGIGLSSLIAMIFRFGSSSVTVASKVNPQFILSISVIFATILGSIFVLTRYLDVIQQNTKIVGLSLCTVWMLATLFNILIEFV